MSSRKHQVKIVDVDPALLNSSCASYSDGQHYSPGTLTKSARGELASHRSLESDTSSISRLLAPVRLAVPTWNHRRRTAIELSSAVDAAHSSHRVDCGFLKEDRRGYVKTAAQSNRQSPLGIPSQRRRQSELLATAAIRRAGSSSSGTSDASRSSSPEDCRAHVRSVESPPTVVERRALSSGSHEDPLTESLPESPKLKRDPPLTSQIRNWVTETITALNDSKNEDSWPLLSSFLQPRQIGTHWGLFGVTAVGEAFFSINKISTLGEFESLGLKAIQDLLQTPNLDFVAPGQPERRSETSIMKFPVPTPPSAVYKSPCGSNTSEKRLVATYDATLRTLTLREVSDRWMGQLIPDGQKLAEWDELRLASPPYSHCLVFLSHLVNFLSYTTLRVSLQTATSIFRTTAPFLALPSSTKVRCPKAARPKDDPWVFHGTTGTQTATNQFVKDAEIFCTSKGEALLLVPGTDVETGLFDLHSIPDGKGGRRNEEGVVPKGLLNEDSSGVSSFLTEALNAFQLSIYLERIGELRLEAALQEALSTIINQEQRMERIDDLLIQIKQLRWRESRKVFPILLETKEERE